MSRPKRFGRDRNLVSDGTIKLMMCTFTSNLCTGQWHLHHTCPCYRLGLSSMYIKDSPMKKHVQFVFVTIMFSNFFPIILPWD